MSTKPLDGMALDALVKVVDHLRAWVSFLASLLRGVLVLGATGIWVVFWGAVARLHLSMGDVFAAILTAMLCVGPLLLAGLGWVSKTVRDDGTELGAVGL